MKILALDVGDVWVGTAISDELMILARPYKTVKLPELHAFLALTIPKENLKMVVVGNPITMGGNVSGQTKIVQHHFDVLKKKFPEVEWILWDERLSSKRAQTLRPGMRTKEEKTQEHSLAAAFILTTYLDYLKFQQSSDL